MTSFISLLGTADALLSQVSQRKGLAPSSQFVYNAVASASVRRVVVFRTPLQKAIGFALNVGTAAAWSQQAAKRGFDSVFHLGLWLECVDARGVTRSVVVEKNETVQVYYKTLEQFDHHTQIQHVALRDRGVTLKAMFDASIATMGSGAFWAYNYRSNNCQVFVENLLGNVDMLTPALHDFIFQPIDDIARASMNPLSDSFIHWATDRAGRFRSLIGAGLPA